ncbi:hypothetical protein MmmBen326_0708 [Mycoplasma mycoides subsp. mycoides]|nr:hypothetical protein MmmBen326_0708 [Mycoplasma mycoides subsp. mycoides]
MLNHFFNWLICCSNCSFCLFNKILYWFSNCNLINFSCWFNFSFNNLIFDSNSNFWLINCSNSFLLFSNFSISVLLVAFKSEISIVVDSNFLLYSLIKSFSNFYKKWFWYWCWARFK